MEEKKEQVYIFTEQQFRYLISWVEVSRNDLPFRDNIQMDRILQQAIAMPPDIIRVYQECQKEENDKPIKP